MTKQATIAYFLVPAIRRVNLAVYLNALLVPLACLLAGYATMLLLLKMLAPSLDWLAHLALLGLPIVFLFAYIRCRLRKLFFSAYQIAEVVDHLYRNDGSITAAMEQPGLISVGQITQLLARELKGRMLRLDLLFYAKRAIPILAYTALAIFVPPRIPAAIASGQQILTTITQPLYEKLEINEEMLPEEERLALEKELKELAESPQGISREKWEAVEEMEKRIEEAASEAQSTLGQLAEDLSNLSKALSRAGETQADSPQEAQLTQLAKDIGMQMQGGNLPLSAAQKKSLKQMLREMRRGEGMRGDLQKRLAELQKELAERLKSGEGQMGDAGMEGEGEGGNRKDGDGAPGRGGINRGRGDAAMAYGEERILGNARVERKEIENQFLSAEDLADLGVTPIEPSVDPGRFSPGTLQNFQPLQGSAVSRSRISPSQSDAVAQYFAVDKAK